MRSFNKPVLLVTGTQTSLLHKRIDQLLLTTFPMASEVFIESGHAIVVTAPKALVEAILAFTKKDPL